MYNLQCTIDMEKVLSHKNVLESAAAAVATVANDPLFRFECYFNMTVGTTFFVIKQHITVNQENLALLSLLAD